MSFILRLMNLFKNRLCYLDQCKTLLGDVKRMRNTFLLLRVLKIRNSRGYVVVPDPFPYLISFVYK